MDTVYVVAGRGRIEKVRLQIDFRLANSPHDSFGQHLLILIYLLLKRDLKIFSVGRSRVLHPEELPNSASSIAWVLDAAVFRVQDLSGELLH